MIDAIPRVQCSYGMRVCASTHSPVVIYDDLERGSQQVS
jgi:hypothetical protein